MKLHYKPRAFVPAIRKLILMLIFAIFVCSSIASAADASLTVSFPAGNPTSAVSSSDPIDTFINISLVILVSLTIGAGCLQLYLTWKENRDAAREDAREEELWK